MSVIGRSYAFSVFTSESVMFDLRCVATYSSTGTTSWPKRANYGFVHS